MTMFDRRTLPSNYCWSFARAPTKQEQFLEIGIVRIWSAPQLELVTHSRNPFHRRHLLPWVRVCVSGIADLVPRAPDNRKPAHYWEMKGGKKSACCVRNDGSGAGSWSGRLLAKAGERSRYARLAAEVGHLARVHIPG